MTKGTKRTLEDADPDYDDYADVSSQENKRQKIIEQTGKEESIKKITDILTKQFDEQEGLMEEGILDIEDQLHECRQVMERLRGWLVTGYYQNGSEPIGEVPTIHPAVKHHLGKAPRNITTPAEKPSVQAPEVQVKQETDPVPSVSGSKVAESPKRGSRFKSKKTIIVGNVSMFIPSQKRDEHDRASHKWMVYVRGPKDQPDISGFVQKVLFLLDRSYFPNDMVEVTEPPFTLTRRGWGEFRIRVQLFFHDRRNKKVDIIHPIKLDRTYTGLQTLGAETTVEIELEKDRREMSNQPKRPKSVSRQLSLESKPVTVDHEKATSSDTKESTVNDKATSDRLKVLPSQGSDETVKNVTPNISLSPQTKVESTATLSVTTKSASNETAKAGLSKVTVTSTPTSVFCIISQSQGASSSTATPQFLAIPNQIPQLQQKTLLSPNLQVKGDKVIAKQQVFSPALLRAPATSLSPRGVGARLNQLRAVIQSPKRSTTISQMIGQAGSVISPQAAVAGQRAQMSVLPAGQVFARSPTGQIYCLLKSPTQLITVRPGTSAVTSKTQSITSASPSSSAEKQIPGILQRSSLPSMPILKTIPSTTVLKSATTTLTSAAVLKQVTSPSVSLIKPTIKPSTTVLKQQLGLISQSSTAVSTTKQGIDAQKLVQISSLITQTSASKPAQFVLANQSHELKTSTQGTTILKPAPIVIQPTSKGPQTILTTAGPKGPQTLVLQATGIVNPAVRGANAVSLLRPVAPTTTSAIIGKKQVSLLTGKTLISAVDKTGAPTIIPPISQAPMLTIKPQDVSRRILGPLDKSRTIAMKTNNSQSIVSNLVAKVVPKDVGAGSFENIESIVRFVVRYHPLIGTGNTDRSQHPYCAPSVDTFRGWNVAKRRASEWCRASAIRRDVKRIIGDGCKHETETEAELEFEGEKLWSRRDIVLWCRNHCYSPIDDEIKSRLQKGSSQWFGDYASLSEPPTIDVPLTSAVNSDSDDEDIDVENDNVGKPCLLSPYKQRIADEERRRQGTTLEATVEAEYVGTVAKQIGVDLAPSELAPGVFGSASSQMIWTVYERIVEDVLRQSCAVLYQNNTMPEEISANEVYRAFLSIPVCDFLTNKGLGAKPMCSNVQDIEK